MSVIQEEGLPLKNAQSAFYKALQAARLLSLAVLRTVQYCVRPMHTHHVDRHATATSLNQTWNGLTCNFLYSSMMRIWRSELLAYFSSVLALR